MQLHSAVKEIFICVKSGANCWTAQSIQENTSCEFREHLEKAAEGPCKILLSGPTPNVLTEICGNKF